MAMKKKSKSSVSVRAWRLLRLALIWARKGGAFKRGLMPNLRMLFRGIRAGETRRQYYLEREFSFDESPALNFKMHRHASMRLPRIPCITPAVDFENDGEDWICGKNRDLLRSEEDEEELDCKVTEEEERGIDSKAEEFIARFYEEMKFQRQVSFLEYNEMLRRGIS